ncbi:WxL protein peptidoglycan domain-containing protein [Microbacterium sp. BH-3-3-3]|uniref:WxL protein peptidoglycan domain-containing protein n=1 Tax=Microbacterium sp. BH-3-3-3 TaxID=1906742 RepID=UPI0009F3C621|nr:DUF916 domain-containing protein [Microbacterium sp. BH-3-3-3]
MTASPSLRVLALAGTLVLGLSTLPLPAAAADGGVAWSVQTADNANGTGRANFSYDVDPGAVVTDTMVVVNTGTEPLPLAVYAADAFTAPSGEIDVLVDGAPSLGAGTWVAVPPTALQLAPGESADVAFTITVPADARPGDHAAGIVTSLTSQDASSTLSVDRRLGTRINLRVAGELTPAAAVTGVTASYEGSWNPFDSGRLIVRYSLENTGNTRLTGLETVTTSGLAGVLSSTTTPTQVTEIIPASTIDMEREMPAFSLGWITGTLTIAPAGVGLGAGAVSEVVTDFAIPAVPWSLYGLIALVAGAAVAIALVVRRSMRRRDAGRPAADAQAV